MNRILLLIRWIVGILFIFSGLVKANDPNGLSYKMQEFFEAWGWTGLDDYTLLMAVGMNAFEIIAGLALIFGLYMRLLSWVLLGLIVFFTFLTGYASLATNPDGSMKFHSCGCFGDCLPLDPTQSFLKDLILLALIVILLIKQSSIRKTFQSVTINRLLLFVSVLFGLGFQWYTLNYLPLVDCLPFKKGNDLLEMRKMPVNAIPDSFDIRFIYSKGGVDQEFDRTALPDSTWSFKDRKQVLVRKGKNNEPPIKDFILKDDAGNDLTEQILSRSGTHYLVFIQTTQGLKADDPWIASITGLSTKSNVTIITAVPDQVRVLLGNQKLSSSLQIVSCDVTAIKTAARTVPVLYRMQGSRVVEKISGAAAASWN